MEKMTDLLREITGTRERARTFNLRLRRPSLYPVELLAQVDRLDYLIIVLLLKTILLINTTWKI